VDTPFIVTDFKWGNDLLILTTNMDQTITPNVENPIYCKNDKPYCRVDRNIPVRLNRMVRDKLIDIALSQNGFNEATQTLILKANGHDHIIACS